MVKDIAAIACLSLRIFVLTAFFSSRCSAPRWLTGLLCCPYCHTAWRSSAVGFVSKKKIRDRIPEI